MIRIDEIYDNIFWPWLKQNFPTAKMFFCDPPGNTDPGSLCNYVPSAPATNYVFFHDQEPIQLDAHAALFAQTQQRNTDIQVPATGRVGHVIVSEQGEYVQTMCEQYDWTSHYYFFHGWACMDWFRGYDKTFLIARYKHRQPSKTFMSPNRIIGGKRDHRVLFLYHVFKNNLADNHLSAPKVCPHEMVDISSVALKYCNRYADIEQVFAQANLPRMFAGEHTQQMISYRLSNLQEAQDSLIYVPTETVYFGRRQHLTEKTFKAIALEMPFVLIAPAGSLEYLRSYGFKTFNHVFDESYDHELDDFLRLEKATKLLSDIHALSIKEKQHIHRACQATVEHNFNHFFGAGFANILWSELTHMLRGLHA